jgi:hypothetical protein
MRDRDRRDLIHQLLHEAATTHTDADPSVSTQVDVMVASALLAAASADLLADAMRLATSTADRQFVTIAAAHLAGDHDRVDALIRDHALDHPVKPLLAWIAARSASATTDQGAHQ